MRAPRRPAHPPAAATRGGRAEGVSAIATPAHPDRRGLALGLALVAVMAIGIAVVAGGDSGRRSAPSGSAAVHGTEPPPLDVGDVARAGAAFGIAAEPERIEGGWEAEDRVRSLYVWRSPSAWYVQFEDASLLLGPAADRDVVCAAPDPPFGCGVPGVEFAADMAARPPDARTAARVARATLARAGLLPGTWRLITLPPGTDAAPCRPGLDTAFDCTRQVVPTRAVMLTHSFGPGTTAARWGVIVGPRGTVLSVTGRLAEVRHT